MIGIVGTCVEIKWRYIKECFDRTNKQETANKVPNGEARWKRIRD